MSTQPRPWRRILAFVGVGLSLVIAGLAWTEAPARSGSPVRVAIVDLNRVFNGLAEFKDARQRLQAEGEEANKGLKELSDRRDKISKDMEKMRQEHRRVSDDFLAALASRSEIDAQGKARKTTTEQLLEFKGGDNLREVYAKVLAACEQIQASDGWDLVLRDDRSSVPPESTPEGLPLSEREVAGIIAQRTILAAAKPVDITQQVIDKMNNAYRASSSGAATGH